MIVSTRTKQLFVSVLDKGMIGPCCTRTCVGRVSLSRCNVGILYHSRSTLTCSQHRFLSSARPLPDDDHGEISWLYDEETRVRSVKRAPPPYSNAQQSLSQLNSATDDSNSIEYHTIKEDESNEIVNTPSIQPLSKKHHDHDAATIITLKNPSASAIATEHEQYLSPSTLRYTGDAVIPITSLLRIVKPQDDTPRGIWPVFRLLVSRPSSPFAF